MDISSAHHHQLKSKGMKNNGRKKMNRKDTNSVKVVYISSPMKVKTSVSRFRTLVQELTGRDSDVSGLTELNDESPEIIVGDNSNDYKVEISEKTIRDSPTSSESFMFEPLDDVFSSQMVEELEEMFPSNLFNFHNFHDQDVFGEHGAV